VGLDHDHVWGILKLIASEPDGELVAIADTHPELIQRAKATVPENVKFFSDYVAMLDEVKPDAVIVTTANNRHLEILRACAQRKIHFDTEKPMAASGADAREMERIAREAGIKLMVNYANAWAEQTQEALRQIEEGAIGKIQKIIVQFGHEGPKEIGTSKYFSDWLYDPVKNGAGALMDFGCYGADWAMVLKGRPQRVYATSLKLKTEQHNAVEDDATVLLEYADATAILMPPGIGPTERGKRRPSAPKVASWLEETGCCFIQPRVQPAGKTRRGRWKPNRLPARSATAWPISCTVSETTSLLRALSRQVSTWA
jgi:predicted dehydrogenase